MLETVLLMCTHVGDDTDPQTQETMLQLPKGRGRDRQVHTATNKAFPGGSAGKESACKAGDPGSVPGSGRSPGGGNGSPTLAFWPGESHGQRSLAGYSSWGHKELDTTE